MEESKQKFATFLDLCRKVTNNDSCVLESLQQNYQSTNQHFLWSENFRQLIDKCSAKITTDSSNKLVHIIGFVDDLKQYKGKPLKHLLQRSDNSETSPCGNPSSKRSKLESAEVNPALQNTLESRSCSLIPLSNLVHSKDEQKTSTVTSECEVIDIICDTDDSDSVCCLSDHEVNVSLKRKTASTCSTSSPSRPVDTDKHLSATGVVDKPTVIPFSTSCSIVASESSSVLSGRSFPTCSVDRASSSPIRSLGVDKPSTTSSGHSFSTSVVNQATSCSTGVENSLALQSEASFSTNIATRPLLPPIPPICSTDVDEPPPVPSPQRVSGTRIKRLEALFEKLSEKIQRVQEREMSLDDLDKEDSAYLLEERLKKKFMKAYELWSELIGGNKSTGCEMEKPVQFKGTKYDEFNRKVSHFVNKHRTFPDYQDVLQILHYCNKKYGYELRKSALESLARDSFTSLGGLLQNRRIKDFVSNIGCNFTDRLSAEGDPAVSDAALKKELDLNRITGLNNMEQVINKYAEKQTQNADSDNETSEDETEDGSDYSVSDIERIDTPNGDSLITLSPLRSEVPVVSINDKGIQSSVTDNPIILPTKLSSGMRPKNVFDNLIADVPIQLKLTATADPDDVVCLRQMALGHTNDTRTQQHKLTNPVSCPPTLPLSAVKRQQTSEMFIEIDDDVVEEAEVNGTLPKSLKQAVALAWTPQSRDALKTVVAKALKDAHDGSGNERKSVSPVTQPTSPMKRNTNVPSTEYVRVIGQIVSIGSPKSPHMERHSVDEPEPVWEMPTKNSHRSPNDCDRLPATHQAEHSRRSSGETSYVQKLPQKSTKPTLTSHSFPRSRGALRAARLRKTKLRTQDILEISSQIVASVMNDTIPQNNEDVIVCDVERSSSKAVTSRARASSSSSSSALIGGSTASQPTNSISVVAIDDDSDDDFEVSYVGEFVPRSKYAPSSGGIQISASNVEQLHRPVKSNKWQWKGNQMPANSDGRSSHAQEHCIAEPMSALNGKVRSSVSSVIVLD